MRNIFDNKLDGWLNNIPLVTFKNPQQGLDLLKDIKKIRLENCPVREVQALIEKFYER